MSSSTREKSSTSKAARDESSKSTSKSEKKTKSSDSDEKKSRRLSAKRTSDKDSKAEKSERHAASSSSSSKSSGGDDKKKNRRSTDPAAEKDSGGEGKESKGDKKSGLMRRKSLLSSSKGTKDVDKKDKRDAKDREKAEKSDKKAREKEDKKTKKDTGGGTLRKSASPAGATSASAAFSASATGGSPSTSPVAAKSGEKRTGSGISKATPKSLGKATPASSKMGGDFLQRLEGIERTKTAVDFTKSHATSQVKKGAKAVEEAEWDDETQDKVPTAIRLATIELGRDELSAFANAGEKIGLEIWRIEKMLPVRVPKKKYGKFYAGDSYLCLNTSYKDGRSRTLQWELHYWIGRKAPKDSASSAAIRSIQLNEKIGGQAVHYREVQGHESEKFQQLFNYKIKYLRGGTESALNHVTEEAYETRLLHLLGKKGVVRQVDATCGSLNEGDVFVLDAGKNIFVWVGKEAGLVKQSKGLEIANMINSENKGMGMVSLLLGAERENSPLFWEVMGGKGEIAPAEEAMTDKEVAEEMAESVFLYKVMEVDGDMQAIPITETPFVRDMLESTFTYILDCETEIFIWVGKKSDWESKASGIMLADDFLTMFERPSWTPMTRMLEGTETVLFKSKFANWVDIHPTRDFREIEFRKQQANIAATPAVQPKIDVDLMHARPEKDEFSPDKEFPGIDEDSGLVEIWVIDDKSHAAAVGEDNFGEFYNGRSYIVLYSFTIKESIRSVAYFLGGSRAAPSDYIAYQTGLYEQLEEKMESEGGKAPIQIRHQLFAESDYFRTLFEGLMIVHCGADPDAPRPEKSLYGIWGTSPQDVRAVQVEHIGAAQLSSAGVFVLFTATHAFKWLGAGATDESKAMADHLVQHMGEDKEVVVLEEGSETDEFWLELGGKAEYANFAGRPYGWPRVFQVSEATGVVAVHEVLSYSQSDLDELDVFLLDAYNEVFIWTGRDSSEKERRMAREIAQEYIDRAKSVDGREAADLPLTVVLSGEEPVTFRACFHEWRLHDSSRDLVQVIEKRIQTKIQGIEEEAAKPTELMSDFFNKLNKKYNIDPTQEHLADEPAAAPAPVQVSASSEQRRVDEVATAEATAAAPAVAGDAEPSQPEHDEASEAASADVEECGEKAAAADDDGHATETVDA
ncbi:gelsolin repeatcontaining protein [Acanthamoeba castellanii str. Neff]|uniref:Gelsolin repeatcontaining protein n=1 Tax=Acanthamoeba castellanii (strain ATCC 30010 / Neff) TaxID=1257118 RepID=L8GHT0_ACACF|nr:gelsolin repeatcontaining protein [Acanthamoeba castellanii str. Neff]ELR12318.1 gelsolin repeatcontaining protein [Acanthamoeba castellanii str. Neff]